MNSAHDRKAAIKKLKSLIYSTKQDLDVFRKNLVSFFIPPLFYFDVSRGTLVDVSRETVGAIYKFQ